MKKKKSVEYITIISIIIIIAVAVLLDLSGITGAATKQQNLKIPDKQCYHIASNLDKAAENVAIVPYSSGERLNPCTGEIMNASSYLDSNVGAFYRIVYENGDAKGFVPLGTSYILCTDRRAEITSRLGVYYYNRGKGWGIYYLWQKNPHLQSPYKVEKCSTI
ncbi:hypothetical protein KY342_01385 [Candidatus Woesearchaeota archaeon]|nr:hypothetical protein [Candidatus Woesearchaeota archaeon]